jgi:phage terminase large subunit
MLIYTPVFEANYKAYQSKKYRAICNEGSSRSSKTYSEMQLASYISLYPEIFGGKEISVVSPSLPHLKKGARKDFLDIAVEWNFFNEDDFNRTDNKYIFPKGYVEFFGVDDAKKVRGPGRDILIINEANLISFETYTQLALRTRETIFLDYNPADEYSWVYGVADNPSNKKIHSTYLNNRGNISKWQIEDIENLKDIDDNLWNVYGLGLRGTSSENIYTNWKQIDHFPDCEQVFYGLDFGYNNPSALVKVGIREKKLYLEEIIYETKLTTNDLAEVIKIMGLTRSCEIVCDAAEPKTIEELRRMGLKATAADKSVYDGIQFMKSMPVYVTKGSANLIKESRSYKWKTDKDGKVLDEPVKFNDHALDAARYAAFTKLSKGRKKLMFGNSTA